MSATQQAIKQTLQDGQDIQALTVIPASTSAVSLGTLHAANAAALVAGAAELAGQLACVIDKQHLATTIKGKRFVNVEGWTTLATMLGVTAREVATVESEGIYTAIVELVRMSDGACVSRASAECGSPDELDKYGKPVWSTRPRYARRSMAQTRATGKACRLAFSWIMSLAGYEVTPAEEMTPLVESGQMQEPPPPLRISPSQLKLLEAQIRDYGLDRGRVEASVKAAWKIALLSELSLPQFEKLLVQLEKWANKEYAKAQAASALCRDVADF
ncbi:hypothetical protein [Methylovulum psychrotolerans]|jgi:hypothetical protein|uniref:Uncharacterized protein n=1 Tax=Methylovulum psychrotolerans TaxID=1704499 RepID=A0A1Z4BV83_9GAMM|nr:hypothetical protein [Methylovulum psychrotolerans]ASF45227.1 hypothetical protein CEK71_03645 [Methylovulum psychrotolerans]